MSVIQVPQQAVDFLLSMGQQGSMVNWANADGLPADDLIDAIMDKLYGQHCGRAVVPCQHCAQWGARYCACRHCGAPVD